MSARIRGHYRIDSMGRVEPMTDVNAPALLLRQSPPVLSTATASRLVRISIAGIVALALAMGGILALPQIQRGIMAAEVREFTAARQLHGHHLHAMASRLIRHNPPPQDQ